MIYSQFKNYLNILNIDFIYWVKPFKIGYKTQEHGTCKLFYEYPVVRNGKTFLSINAVKSNKNVYIYRQQRYEMSILFTQNI